MQDKTMIFTLEDEQDRIIREKLTIVYNALKEKGYNPVNQIVGYLLTEDPTYITTYNSARSVMHSMDRDDILVAMVKNFIV
ncbi:MAG: IreB family regulatory phosphoprotein [Oscillospiraceae bacterium]|nr:IreB family regulatory phosphoprotein [Oscillospiraceae bacterium]MBR0452126.1 IreB family regulatory phosphoprotein [Oscillospiraceae bacterium]